MKLKNSITVIKFLKWKNMNVVAEKGQKDRRETSAEIQKRENRRLSQEKGKRENSRSSCETEIREGPKTKKRVCDAGSSKMEKCDNRRLHLETEESNSLELSPGMKGHEKSRSIPEMEIHESRDEHKESRCQNLENIRNCHKRSLQKKKLICRILSPETKKHECRRLFPEKEKSKRGRNIHGLKKCDSYSKRSESVVKSSKMEKFESRGVEKRESPRLNSETETCKSCRLSTGVEKRENRSKNCQSRQSTKTFGRCRRSFEKEEVGSRRLSTEMRSVVTKRKRSYSATSSGNSGNSQTPASRAVSRDLKCRTCGVLGHKSVDCWYSERMCYNCGAYDGHESRNCPHPLSEWTKAKRSKEPQLSVLKRLDVVQGPLFSVVEKKARRRRRVSLEAGLIEPPDSKCKGKARWLPDFATENQPSDKKWSYVEKLDSVNREDEVSSRNRDRSNESMIHRIPKPGRNFISISSVVRKV